MTVQQLLDWLLRAEYLRKDSWNGETKRYEVCETKALIETAPTIEHLGYTANTGELQLATTLMFTCSRDEICEMSDYCWANVSIQPVETGLGNVALDATPVFGLDPMPVPNVQPPTITERECLETGEIITITQAHPYEYFWQDLNNRTANDMHREIAEMLAAMPPPQENDEA